MSIRMNPGMSRLTVLGKGWNDNAVMDSGDGFTVDEEIWGDDDDIWGDDDDIWGDDDEIWKGDAFQFTVSPASDTANPFFLEIKGAVAIDWGDGSTENYTMGTLGAVSHPYENLGEYTVSIVGNLEDISFYDYDFSYNSPLKTVLTPFPATMHNVTDFSVIFRGCCNLTSIPAGLFDNCPNVARFDGSFESCSSLTSIPAGLFDNCPNVASFIDAFGFCSSLTSIPAGLFDNCQNVAHFDGSFEYCSSLTSIPAGLFDNCPNVADFGMAFYGCSSLTSIPAGLFDNCPNVTDFSNIFYGCSSLTSIPAGLFDNCPNVTDFSGAFYSCVSITSYLPELWKTHANAMGYYCFTACENAANYKSVPSGWK